MSDNIRTLTLTIEAPFGPRDVALLVMMGRGVKQEDQATILGVSRPTIISSVGRLFAKLNAPNGTAAVRTADRNGIILDSDDNMSDADLAAYFAAAYDWSAIGGQVTAAAPPKGKGTPTAGKGTTTARKPRAGKVTTRTATGSERAKQKGDQVTASRRAKIAAGVK